jgi:hypothetical protein
MINNYGTSFASRTPCWMPDDWDHKWATDYVWEPASPVGQQIAELLGLTKSTTGGGKQDQ